MRTSLGSQQNVSAKNTNENQELITTMRIWPFNNKQQRAAPDLQAKSASFMFGLGAMRVMQANYATYATEGYGLNPVVRGCTDRIADAITSVDIAAYKKDDKGKYALVEKHPLLDLMNKPNPTMAGDDFLGALVRYYLIAGSAYVLGTGIDPMNPKGKPPKELHLLKPDCVKIEMGDMGLPRAYEYKDNKGRTTTYFVNQITGMSAVMYKRRFNPIDQWEGLSPMSSSAYGVDIQNEGSKWNLRLLQNEGRPSGALCVKGSDGLAKNLSDEQYLRLKEQIDQQFTGASNAGRPLLLEGGLDWKEMSMNAKDMDHQQNINNAKRDIALAYGVPPQLLGIPGDATYSNMAEARLALWTDTVLPLLRSMLGSLNNWLAPCYDDGVELWFDEDTIPALEPLRKTKSDRIEASNSLTINEKRKAMGHEPVEGGDVLLVDSSKIPLELIGDMGLSEVGSTQDINGQQTALAGGQQTISQVALNGAQMSSLQQIVQSVADGLLPAATAIELIMISIPTISREEALRLVSPAANFTPSTQEPQQSTSA